MRINARKFIDWLIPDKKIADEFFESVGSPLAATIPENWKNENNRKEPIFDPTPFDGSNLYPVQPAPLSDSDVLAIMGSARSSGLGGIVKNTTSKRTTTPVIADGKLDGADLLKLMR